MSSDEQMSYDELYDELNDEMMNVKKDLEIHIPVLPIFTHKRGLPFNYNYEEYFKDTKFENIDKTIYTKEYLNSLSKKDLNDLCRLVNEGFYYDFLFLTKNYYNALTNLNNNYFHDYTKIPLIRKVIKKTSKTLPLFREKIDILREIITRPTIPFRYKMEIINKESNMYILFCNFINIYIKCFLGDKYGSLYNISLDDYLEIFKSIEDKYYTDEKFRESYLLILFMLRYKKDIDNLVSESDRRSTIVNMIRNSRYFEDRPQVIDDVLLPYLKPNIEKSSIVITKKVAKKYSKKSPNEKLRKLKALPPKI
jgi:hypothetical protein